VSLVAFFEAQFFHPRWYHYPVIVLFLPLSLLYGVVMLLRRLLTPKKHFDIPIVSVGNLVVGGAGKTPCVIAIANQLEGCVVISRGYGRESRGLVEVSQNGTILTTVAQSGDEAMLLARSLPHASVIVSEDRVKAIEVAIAKGAKVVVLDDGFNRVNIAKFEIVLEPLKVYNYLPFPSGGFREFWFSQVFASMVLKEGRDFKRVVRLPEHLPQKLLLVTAISQPQRLEKYLPQGVVYRHYQKDHSYFDRSELAQLLKEYDAEAILCTSKDRVKMEGFDLPMVEMVLRLELNGAIMAQVKHYVEGFNV
jgi:tetraacyldisaccharide 4'-kinase